MDSKPRSTIPVAVTVASEQEPVTCSGNYTEQSDGFTLQFCLRDDSFTIEHTKAATRVRAKGVMNYDIELNDAVTFALISTPFGEMKFEVRTYERCVVKLNDTVKIMLSYAMENAAAGKMDRAVDITVALNSDNTDKRNTK